MLLLKYSLSRKLWIYLVFMQCDARFMVMGRKASVIDICCNEMKQMCILVTTPRCENFYVSLPKHTNFISNIYATILVDGNWKISMRRLSCQISSRLENIYV